jgi:predicted  nucleic acid-binding Zn-ribbon protein
MGTVNTLNFKLLSVGRIALVGIAACSMALVTPAMARESSGRSIVINIGKDGDLLEQLIDLDREGIEDMRADIADARADVADAIKDIEEAREEVKGVPGARIVLKIAFASARAGVSTAIDEALGDARVEIDKAERGLAIADVSDEERAETQEAIDVLRTELDALEESLNELTEALRA